MLAKVLLVEHDATIASELEIGLRANGCDVTLLTDGETGFARAASDRFDVSLLSGELPGMSGFRLCNRIKEDPSTRDVTTFVMSTSPADLEAHRRLPTHANAYFRRPVSLLDVLKQIRAAVGEIEESELLEDPRPTPPRALPPAVPPPPTSSAKSLAPLPPPAVPPPAPSNPWASK